MSKNSKKMSFGFGSLPTAQVEVTEEKFFNTPYILSDGSNVNSGKIYNITNNPNHEYLQCRPHEHYEYKRDDFDIVKDEEKWKCRYNKLGYYKKDRNSDFILLPNGKYWDYAETYYDKKLKHLPEDKYYDGNILRNLPEMYFYDPLKGELQLIPYDDENDKSKRCARRIWDSEKNRYKCTKYRCRDCYNCDTQTGTCKDTVLSKAWCSALKQNTGCNYESFTAGYMGDKSSI